MLERWKNSAKKWWSYIDNFTFLYSYVLYLVIMCLDTIETTNKAPSRTDMICFFKKTLVFLGINDIVATNVSCHQFYDTVSQYIPMWHTKLYFQKVYVKIYPLLYVPNIKYWKPTTNYFLSQLYPLDDLLSCSIRFIKISSSNKRL